MDLEIYSKLFKMCVVSIIKVCLNSLKTLRHHHHHIPEQLFVFFAKILKHSFVLLNSLVFGFYKQHVLTLFFRILV